MHGDLGWVWFVVNAWWLIPVAIAAGVLLGIFLLAMRRGRP